MTESTESYGDPVELPPLMVMNPDVEYQHDIMHLKRRYQYDNIALYTSPEFRILRQRLIRIVGEVEANNIMNANL